MSMKTLVVGAGAIGLVAYLLKDQIFEASAASAPAQPAVGPAPAPSGTAPRVPQPGGVAITVPPPGAGQANAPVQLPPVTTRPAPAAPASAQAPAPAPASPAVVAPTIDPGSPEALMSAASDARLASVSAGTLLNGWQWNWYRAESLRRLGITPPDFEEPSVWLPEGMHPEATLMTAAQYHGYRANAGLSGLKGWWR